MAGDFELSRKRINGPKTSAPDGALFYWSRAGRSGFDGSMMMGQTKPNAPKVSGRRSGSVPPEGRGLNLLWLRVEKRRKLP